MLTHSVESILLASLCLSSLSVPVSGSQTLKLHLTFSFILREQIGHTFSDASAHADRGGLASCNSTQYTRKRYNQKEDHCCRVSTVLSSYMLVRHRSFSYVLPCFLVWAALYDFSLVKHSLVCEGKKQQLIVRMLIQVVYSTYSRNYLQLTLHHPLGDYNGSLNTRVYGIETLTVAGSSTSDRGDIV